MTTHRTIAATETDPQAPLVSALFKALANNLLAAFEGDATAVAAGVTLRLAALQRLAAGASVRLRNDAVQSITGATFADVNIIASPATVLFPCLQAGVIRVAFEHMRPVGNASEVRIRRTRAQVTTTIFTSTQNNTATYLAESYDADVQPGDQISVQLRNTGANSSNIRNLRFQVADGLALWPATSLFGAIEGNPTI